MNQNDFAKQLPLHFLAEVDIAGPERDPAHDAVPRFSGRIPPSGGKNTAETQNNKRCNAEHLETAHDPFDDVRGMRGLGGCVLQAD